MLDYYWRLCSSSASPVKEARPAAETLRRKGAPCRVSRGFRRAAPKNKFLSLISLNEKTGGYTRERRFGSH